VQKNDEVYGFVSRNVALCLVIS